MISQANDATVKSWVMGDEHRLRKKGVGRGLHTSGCISSTSGWLDEGCEILKYGKNHDGFWTGELFVKQVGLSNVEDKIESDRIQLKEKIIPAFEVAHGAGYQALFLIDNSQGHSAYGEDALLILQMNIKPGGKQAHMRNGWYIHDGIRVSQSMVYSHDHPDHPDMPKGVKAILVEHGLWQPQLQGKCDKACKPDANNCCNKCILELQPNFCEQKSLVQETIEAAGHLCLFLLKFHCELNFIEFFWGMVKKYLCENCDYTFDMLKKNLPNALHSVHIHTI
jgi:hypothetical protein